MTIATDQLAALGEHIRPQLEHPALAVLAYGSFVEGLSNPLSDIDLLALTEGTRSLQLLEFEGERVHVEYIPLAELEEEIRDLDWNLRMRAFDFQFTVMRLGRAVILHDPAGVAESLVWRVREYQPSEGTLLKLRGQALGLYQDAVGAFKVQEWEHAVLLARLATQILTSREILSRGELGIGLKWQHRWAQRTIPEDEAWWVHYRSALGLPVAAAEAEGAARQTLQAASALLRREATR